jgi:protein gp37
VQPFGFILQGKNGIWAPLLRPSDIKEGACFFFKQWGGVRKKKAGRELQGRVWEQMPRLPRQLDFAALQA